MIIQGRTVEEFKERTKAVPNAQIEVIGIWYTLSSVLEDKSLPNMIFIHPPLYKDRSPQTRCERGALSAVEGDDKVLLHPAQEGTNRIRLSNSKNLKPKNLLKINVVDNFREEILSVKKLDPGATPDQPAWVTVDWPLRFSHRDGALAQRLEPKWNGSAVELVRDGYQGDACLFLNSLKDLSLGSYVRIVTTQGDVADEYHRFSLFKTSSDNEGFYRLPPLQRVAQVQLCASNNGKKAQVTLQPDYSSPRNQVDFVLKKPQQPLRAEANHA